MKQLSSADFRKSYASEAEPVEVTSYGKIIGTWTPSGFDVPANPPSLPADSQEAAAPEPEAKQRMSIRPVKESKRSPLVGSEKRIIDTVQARQHEREVWSQLQAKMYPSTRGKR